MSVSADESAWIVAGMMAHSPPIHQRGSWWLAFPIPAHQWAGYTSQPGRGAALMTVL